MTKYIFDTKRVIFILLHFLSMGFAVKAQEPALDSYGCYEFSQAQYMERCDCGTPYETVRTLEDMGQIGEYASSNEIACEICFRGDFVSVYTPYSRLDGRFTILHDEGDRYTLSVNSEPGEELEPGVYANAQDLQYTLEIIDGHTISIITEFQSNGRQAAIKCIAKRQ